MTGGEQSGSNLPCVEGSDNRSVVWRSGVRGASSEELEAMPSSVSPSGEIAVRLSAIFLTCLPSGGNTIRTLEISTLYCIPSCVSLLAHGEFTAL